MRQTSGVVRVCPAECLWITAGATGLDTGTLSPHHNDSVAVQKIKIKAREQQLSHKSGKGIKYNLNYCGCTPVSISNINNWEYCLHFTLKQATSLIVNWERERDHFSNSKHTQIIPHSPPLHVLIWFSAARAVPLNLSNLSAVLLMVAVKALISLYSADRQIQWSASWKAARRRPWAGGGRLDKMVKESARGDATTLRNDNNAQEKENSSFASVMIADINEEKAVREKWVVIFNKGALRETFIIGMIWYLKAVVYKCVNIRRGNSSKWVNIQVLVIHVGI